MKIKMKKKQAELLEDILLDGLFGFPTEITTMDLMDLANAVQDALYGKVVGYDEL